jgi:hypothetical protein
MEEKEWMDGSITGFTDRQPAQQSTSNTALLRESLHGPCAH